jgi:hypothetical protein
VALRLLLRDVGEQNMVYIYNQTHGSGSDTLWNINDSLRIIYYGLTSVPTTFADGCSTVVGSGGVQADSAEFARWYNARRAVQSPLQMTLTGIYNRGTRQGRAKVAITATDNITPTNLKIRYCLLENLPYSWGTDTTVIGIDHVQRNMLPDWNGVSLTISNGETKADSQSFTLASGWNPDSCEIAVFVQSDQTKEVLQGVWGNLPTFSGTEGNPTKEIPESYFLSAPSPSPCTQKAQITFGLPRESDVSLKVYNLMGREVKTLVSGHEKAGWQTVSWDAKDLSGRPVPGGVYFFRLEVQGWSLTRRAVVLR